MALACTFKLTDGEGRHTLRTWTTTSSLLADALTDIAAFATILDGLSDCGLSGVVITQKDASEDFAAVAGSNIDEGVSIKVTAEDGYDYVIKVPIPVAAVRTGGGTIDLSDILVTAFTDQFLTGGKWRVNQRNPKFITAVNKGLLDK